MRTDELAGARWWKVDFHAHTPFSRDSPWHGRVGQPDEVTPEKWLRMFMAAGIDCVAITDHIDGGWIDRLKEAYQQMRDERAEGFRELFLFAGVEISDAVRAGGLALPAHADQDKAQPGERFTWVKMGRPSLEGLRFALLDGSPLSIRNSDDEAGDPNQHAALVVEEIVVHEARYAGRGEPLRVRFSPWLSTLIGGRGSGKSTVIEMLRLSLRRQDDLPDALLPAFARFAKVPQSRDDEGALAEGTKVEVIVRKDGGRFRITWRQDGQGSVIEEQVPDGRWTEAAGHVPSRFPVRIFSQKHVFALSEDPNALLRLIDEAPGVGRAEWDRTWGEAEARFLRLRGECRELQARVSDNPRIQGELADVRRQLAVFEEGGHRELLVRYQRSRRQRRALDDRDQELARSEVQLREVATALTPADVREENFDAANTAERSALDLLRDAAIRQQELSNDVLTLADRTARYREEWAQRLSAAEWAAEEGEIAAEYQQLVARLEAEGIRDPTTYGALVQRRQMLEKQDSQMEAIRQRISELEEQSEEALKELGKLRLELSERRSKFLTDVLARNRYVRMKVVPFGDDPLAAEPGFRSHLAGEDDRLRDDILSESRERGVLVELYQDLPASVDRGPELVERIAGLKASMCTAASGGEVPERTKWFHNHLRGLRPEQLDRLQLWWPEDALRVEYRRTHDREDYVSIEQGSPGQKSAAILAFLLSYGDEPIVLDQPEDDLDNHLIYDLIVQQIRENKRQRQVIVATHNPNIVVNGDAEMVVAMDHRGGQCKLIDAGTGCLQDRGVRDEICRVMEGGRRAFEERYRRILEEVSRV